MRSGVPALPVLDRGGARVRYSRGRAAPRKDAAPLAPLMKLDPVYLVAPEPQRDAKRFSRRACLGLAALGFGFGAMVGSGLRRALASGGTATAIDAELQWAIELQRGPLERLVRDRGMFLALAGERRSQESDLLVGVQRLARHALDESVDRTARAPLARDLVAYLESVPVPDQRLLAALRQVAR